MMFTVSFTSIPVLIQGLTEQPFSKEELLQNPFLYRNITRNELMSFRKCFRWIVVGIWHILLCYYLPRFVWTESGAIGIDDYGTFSLFISSILVLLTDTKVLTTFTYKIDKYKVYWTSYRKLIVFFFKNLDSNWNSVFYMVDSCWTASFLHFYVRVLLYFVPNWIVSCPYYLAIFLTCFTSRNLLRYLSYS